jgi:hypothetical protein
MPIIESDSLIAPPNFLERAANRIIQELRADAEDWAKISGQVGLYPWTHFVENPKPEDLLKHKDTLKRLIAFGELLNGAMSFPSFPDKEVAGGVAASMRMLKDGIRPGGHIFSWRQLAHLFNSCRILSNRPRPTVSVQA